MIPKKIHYCWFGGNQLPEYAKKCIDSWKKFCPDYEIIEWNESNYDVNKNEYMSQAYNNKKWAFVSDYARLDIIYNYGGVYLDTDVELIKSIDNLLEHDAFAGVEQDSEYVSIGLGFGAKQGDLVVKAIRDNYDKIRFEKDSQIDLTPAPKIHTEALIKLGYVYSKDITKVDTFTIYPSEYFCPINNNTGKINITEKTYSIHHYTASWHDESSRYALTLRRKYGKFMPKRMASVLATAVAKMKYEGFFACMKWIFKRRGK